MGLVTIMRSNYLQLTNGLFFIKDEKGTYERANNDGTKTRGHASNGFQCYLKSVSFETKAKIVDGREVKESSWRFELIDDNSECFIMDFRSESSTAFRFLNCLASIKKFGLLELESWQSSKEKNGKPMLFQHINVRSIISKKESVKVEPLFPKAEVPDPEPLKDSDGEPIYKNGYAQLSYKKKIKFFLEKVLPVIQENLKGSIAADNSVKFEHDEEDGYHVQDDAPPELPVKAKKQDSVFGAEDDEDGVPF